MKAIDVKDQVRLPLAKCVELIVSGLKYRLFRAAITVTIIALAVAFLMTMLTESFVARRVADEIDLKLAPRRMFDFWVGRLASPLSDKDLTFELAFAVKQGPRWREIKAWGSLDDQQLERLAEVAGREVLFLNFFEEDLDEGELRPMVGRVRGDAIFGLLQDAQSYATFEEEFRTLGKQMHTGLAEFKKFLADWQAAQTDRSAILKGNAEALADFKATLGGKDAKAILAGAESSLLAELQKRHFEMAESDLVTIREQAALSLDAERMVRLLSLGMVKNRLADRRNVKLSDINTRLFFDEVSSGSGARWLRKTGDELVKTVEALVKTLPARRLEVAEMARQATKLEDKVEAAKEKLASAKATGADEQVIKEAEGEKELAEQEYKDFTEGVKGDGEKEKFIGLDQRVQDLKRAEATAGSLLPARASIEAFTLSAERIEEVADSRIVQRRLAKIDESVSRSTSGSGGLFGYSSRTMWLIAVSFVVCVVGIANAMLMSVTDRFREIATMKCLGATDGYIMMNFILESCFQGTAGGIIGAGLGFVLGSLRSLWSYGWTAMEHLPVGLVAITAVISLVVGVVLSALAAVYPAWIAARLAPMEAMRIE